MRTRDGAGTDLALKNPFIDRYPTLHVGMQPQPNHLYSLAHFFLDASFAFQL